MCCPSVLAWIPYTSSAYLQDKNQGIKWKLNETKDHGSGEWEILKIAIVNPKTFECMEIFYNHENSPKNTQNWQKTIS